VFIPTAAIVIALLALAAIAPDIATRWFTAAKSWAANDAGWFTILAVAGFLVFVVGVAISSYGRIDSALTTVRRTTATAPGSPCCSLPAWASV
jgi:choline-glycine betaine transporter